VHDLMMSWFRKKGINLMIHMFHVPMDGSVRSFLCRSRHIPFVFCLRGLDGEYLLMNSLRAPTFILVCCFESDISLGCSQH